MSNKFEQILEKQGNPNDVIQEGFQKILLKEIKVNTYDSDYHDTGLDITVAPVEFPDWKIIKTIWGDWNFEVEQKETIWRITGLFDVINQVSDLDIDVKEMFDLDSEPAVLDINQVDEVNSRFDSLKVYGYLFRGRRKNANSNRLFWNVHTLLAASESMQSSIEKSFRNWKNNELVQQYWQFEQVEDNNDDEDDLSFNFGSNVEHNEEELAVPRF